MPGNFIPDGAAVSITNFHVDPYSKGLLQRDGSTRQNSSQLSGNSEVDVFTYVQQDGDEYLIAFASKTVAYSTDNGATFTTLISTGVDGAYWDCATFVDDKEYCVSQATSAFSFNGTVHFVTTQTPAGKYIEIYENRAWVANTSANPGRIYFSDLLLASTWTTSTNYLDFDEPISGLGVINGALAVYTDNNVYMVRGDDPTNFSVDHISKGIGCANNRTIKNMMLKGQEVQVFLSKGYGQTKNNFYANTGIQVVPIGDNYLETLAGINIGNSSSRAKEWDTQADFSAGTFNNTTGTYTSGSVILSTANTNVDNNSFETGSGDDSTNWTRSEATGEFNRFTDLAQNGTYGIRRVAQTYNFDVLDSNDNQLTTQGYASVNGVWTQRTFTMLSYRGQYIKIRFRGTDSIKSDPFFCSGQSITFYDRYDSAEGSTGIDNIEGGKTTISSGTFTSEIYQTDSNLSQWGTFKVEHILNNGTITYEIRTAATSGGVSSASWSSITDGAIISTTTNQFVQWRATISSGTATNLTNVELQKVTINWTSSSGASQQPSSTVYKENYWMTYPGPSESRNQTILVINKDGAMYNLEYGTSSQVGFYGLTTSDGGLYAGDSSTDSANGGYVWKLETGNLDNGQAITASVVLKHQEFGGLELDDWDKTLSAIYFNYAVQNSGNFTVTVYKNFSESSVGYSVPLASGTTINRYKIEPRLQGAARQIGLGFTNSTSGQKLKIYPPITFHFEKNQLLRQQR